MQNSKPLIANKLISFPKLKYRQNCSVRNLKRFSNKLHHCIQTWLHRLRAESAENEASLLKTNGLESKTRCAELQATIKLQQEQLNETSTQSGCSVSLAKPHSEVAELQMQLNHRTDNFKQSVKRDDSGTTTEFDESKICAELAATTALDKERQQVTALRQERMRWQNVSMQPMKRCVRYLEP